MEAAFIAVVCWRVGLFRIILISRRIWVFVCVGIIAQIGRMRSCHRAAHFSDRRIIVPAILVSRPDRATQLRIEEVGLTFRSRRLGDRGATGFIEKIGERVVVANDTGQFGQRIPLAVAAGGS